MGRAVEAKGVWSATGQPTASDLRDCGVHIEDLHVEHGVPEAELFILTDGMEKWSYQEWVATN
ncbi:MAG: hypothetical protein KKB30_12710 [Proteobacteria bacterium]|nr:hypothetical protein [Pseudomonadota bacterium]MBU1717275.1 hypothetical protein [Pseudomonadota bacterium]